MEINDPNTLSHAEKAALKRLKTVVDRALSDSRLTHQEREEIVEIANADHRIS